MSTFIFDFDGTLADTFPLVVDVTYEISKAPRLPEKQIAELRGLPLLSAVRALGVPFWRVPSLTLLTRRRMFPRMSEVPAFDGIAEVLKELNAAGHKICILTSNRRENAEVFLRANNLEHLFNDIVSVYYGNVFYKVYGLRKLLTRNHLRAEDCYYVGNEALDLRAASFVHIRGVAAAWGGFDRAKLLDAKPFAIVDKPKELLEFTKDV